MYKFMTYVSRDSDVAYLNVMNGPDTGAIFHHILVKDVALELLRMRHRRGATVNLHGGGADNPFIRYDFEPTEKETAMLLLKYVN